MRFYTLDGTEYKLHIDLSEIESYNEFNNYVSKYLTEKKNLDNKKTIIKYIYEGNIINLNNFTNYINKDDIAISIIFQQRKKEIYSTNFAFAAINENGNVITWGNSEYGGDSSQVQNQLTNITKIYSVRCAFAAIDENGNVITWGKFFFGGDLRKV